MKKLTCNKAKQIDLVEYLTSLGHQPKKIKNQDYWYLSPLRQENTASFKVDRKLNVWFDHGLGKGGDLIDFGTHYFKCTVDNLLQRLSYQRQDFSFHLRLTSSLAGEKKNTESKIVILDNRPLRDKSLLEYMNTRHISPAIAKPFCREVDFLLYGKKYTVIGFHNNGGGYELRSDTFKGSSSPKDITFIDNSSKQLAVFEGFFNYLSYQEIHHGKQELTNFLVLNSLSFFEKSRPLMEKHGHVNLYLDRDKAGISCTLQALQWDKEKYQDQSHLYKEHEDLNESLKKKQQNKPRQGLKQSF